MKSILLGCGFLCLLALPVLAEELSPYEIRVERSKPMILGDNPRMQVTFEHMKHKGNSCFLCHHKTDEKGNSLVSCASPGCHPDKDRTSRAPNSLFMAMHSPSDHSCMSCHEKREVKKNRNLAGCQPCHVAKVMNK